MQSMDFVIDIFSVDSMVHFLEFSHFLEFEEKPSEDQLF